MFNSISCKERGKKKNLYSVLRETVDTMDIFHSSKSGKKLRDLKLGFFSYFIDNDSLII